MKAGRAKPAPNEARPWALRVPHMHGHRDRRLRLHRHTAPGASAQPRPLQIPAGSISCRFAFLPSRPRRITIRENIQLPYRFCTRKDRRKDRAPEWQGPKSEPFPHRCYLAAEETHPQHPQHPRAWNERRRRISPPSAPPACVSVLRCRIETTRWGGREGRRVYLEETFSINMKHGRKREEANKK